ncbi:glycerophosphodiester phosphodiesterase [Kineococcus sp. R8]|nr:glycerophosphodiester phosphodiesterase [Kineococcus siccus]NAZ80551.1 glycerophosphodiester phosphodiesterase [Kineococcus siccus]
MAHRGFSREGLENSLAAFAAAVDLGYRYLETDARATADGTLIAFHDDRLDRVTDRRGLLSELPWSEVRRARIGGREPVPLLAEVLDAFPRARVNVDVKDEAAVAPLAEVLRRTGAADRVLVTSFSDRRRRAALAAVGRATGARPATSAGTATLVAALSAVRARTPALVRRALAGVDAVQVPVRHGCLEIVTPALVRAVHAAGAQVHVWTVDDPVQMHALLDLGVDGLITDRADLLRDVVVARGQWVPA